MFVIIDVFDRVVVIVVAATATAVVVVVVVRSSIAWQVFSEKLIGQLLVQFSRIVVTTHRRK